jgi:hypothetical protein
MYLLHIEFNGDPDPGPDVRELAVLVAERMALSVSSLNMREKAPGPVTSAIRRRGCSTGLYGEEALGLELHRGRAKKGAVRARGRATLDHFEKFNARVRLRGGNTA